MKKIITMAVGAALSVLSAWADGPTPTFEVLSHDFGNIKEADGPVSYDFEFSNEGDEPLVIISATASCGCTRPEFPKKPIAPGKSAKIKVSYLPAGRPGEFNKTVRVRTNAKRPYKQVNLKISGVVIPSDDKK